MLHFYGQGMSRIFGGIVRFLLIILHANKISYWKKIFALLPKSNEIKFLKIYF